MENNHLKIRSRRIFPTVGDLFAMLGIVLGAQVLVGLLLSVVSGFAGFDAETATAEMVGRNMCIVYLTSMSLGLIGVLIYRRKRGGTGKVVSFSTARLNPILLLWACVFLFAVGIVIEPLLALLPDMQPNMGSGIWTMVMLIVFAPFFEEMICRGVVLGSLRAKYGVVAAWLGSSLFFGVLHLAPQLVVNACLIGLILGYICLATDSIWASILLHAANNALAYAMMSVGGGELLMIDRIGSKGIYAAIYCVALIVAALSAWKMGTALRQMKEAEKNQVAAAEQKA